MKFVWNRISFRMGLFGVIEGLWMVTFFSFRWWFINSFCLSSWVFINIFFFEGFIIVWKNLIENEDELVIVFG